MYLDGKIVTLHLPFACEHMDRCEFTVVATYGMWITIWEAEDGEILQCQQETGNQHDLYGIADDGII